jgi:hypothetical protein
MGGDPRSSVRNSSPGTANLSSMDQREARCADQRPSIDAAIVAGAYGTLALLRIVTGIASRFWGRPRSPVTEVDRRVEFLSQAGAERAIADDASNPDVHGWFEYQFVPLSRMLKLLMFKLSCRRAMRYSINRTPRSF